MTVDPKLFQQPVRIFAAILGANQHRLDKWRAAEGGEARARNGSGLDEGVVRVVSLPFHRPKFEATDLKTGHTTLGGEYLRQIIGIVVRRNPTMCLCVSTGYCGKDPQTDLLRQVRHEMDLDEVEMGITLLRRAGF